MAKLTEIEQLQKKKKRKQMGKNILVVLIAAAVVCAALYLRNSSDFQEFLGTTILGGTGYQEGEGFPVEFTGNTLEIGFNNRYLLDALHNVETDEIRVQLGGPLNPMKILPKEGEAFLFLVLPVRLSSLN